MASISMYPKIPVIEDWNGDLEQSVGQVTPDLTTQISLSYFFRKSLLRMNSTFGESEALRQKLGTIRHSKTNPDDWDKSR